MSPYCPRCDVNFEKDLARCPGCGWDFRAHVVPEGFLEPPIDYSPLKDFPRFIMHEAALVWINGLTVEVLWIVVTLIVYRVAYVALRLLFPGEAEFLQTYVPLVAIVLVLILFFPIWANYLFSLLRRYRYRVPVAFFSVLPPGRSLYAKSLGLGLPCLIAGLVLMAIFLVPGVACLFIFIPMLLLIHLDKRNISDRRKSFILWYTFRKLWLTFLALSVALSVCWAMILGLGFIHFGLTLALMALFLPPQAAFAVLLYESLLGRENLDVD
jgi:hypothetical protein